MYELNQTMANQKQPNPSPIEPKNDVTGTETNPWSAASEPLCAIEAAGSAIFGTSET